MTKRLTEKQTNIIQRFIDCFIVETKRGRAKKLLLGTYEQRIEAIQKLPDWLDRAVQVEADATTPKALAARFGQLQGELVDEDDCFPGHH
jgi:hypothetical protein